MKKNSLMIFGAMALIVVAGLKVTIAGSSEPNPNDNPHNSMHRWVNNIEESSAFVGIKEDQSVAWFVAHTKEAREQNKACYDNPAIKLSTNCINSLNALQLAFAGASGR
ncbi:MAG: hypothetical protein NTV66_02550 [Methylococcales bacterium]|nr:hypothetical protein [Methylococcales bacterium]